MKAKGQSIVEFMLILPILCFMAISAVELGCQGIKKIFSERAQTGKARAADTYEPWFTDEGDTRLPYSAKKDSERGSIVVLVMCTMVMLIGIMLLVVDLGRIAFLRTRLEVAADRAAYAGAASLAGGMNVIAGENWKMNKAWRDLDSDFKKNTQQTEDWKKERIKVFETRYSDSSDEMLAAYDTLRPRAKAAAEHVFSINNSYSVPAELEILIRDEMDISEDAEEPQSGTAKWGHVEGTIFTDPTVVKEGKYTHTRYLMKETDRTPSINVHASAIVRPVFLSGWINDQKIEAASLAQVWGGSISDLAKKETDELSQAEELILQDNYDGLYHAAIVSGGAK